MRNKAVAEELMSGMFLLFPPHTLTPPHPFHLDSSNPSIFIILPHPNDNMASTRRKTHGSRLNESHAFTSVK